MNKAFTSIKQGLLEAIKHAIGAAQDAQLHCPRANKVKVTRVKNSRKRSSIR